MTRIAPQGELRQRQPREEDGDYLKSFKDTPCEACGLNDGTTVPAHFSFENFARSMKADDALAAGLCFKCHQQADSAIKLARADIWLRVLKTRMRERYRAWQETRR